MLLNNYIKVVITFISLWAILHGGHTIESRWTLISFLGTKIKINILAKNPEGGTFVKIIRKENK